MNNEGGLMAHFLHVARNTLVIKKQGKQFEIDDTSPGSPAIGRGRTVKEALGDWLHNNQIRLGISFTVDASAQKAEQRRRRRELSRR
jgi:hypothetical protein